MNRKHLPIIILTMISLTTGYGVAQLILTRQLTATVTLNPQHIELLDMTGTPITEIDIGTLNTGETRDTHIQIHNITPYPLTLSQTITSPTAVTTQLRIPNGAGGYTIWSQNDWDWLTLQPSETTTIQIRTTYTDTTVTGQQQITININTQTTG